MSTPPSTCRVGMAVVGLGEGGVQEHLGWFFKAPMTRDGAQPEHALHRQEQALLSWLAADSLVEPSPTDAAADGRVGQPRA